MSRSLASQRLDVRLARLELEAAGKSRGVDLAASLIDVEVGARRDTRFEGDGDRSTTRGYELDIRLPLFDWGATRRAALDARSLAAANRYEAVARARLVAGRARATRPTAPPTTWRATSATRWCRCARRISDENLLRYNGMLIGVFELLADARDQVAGVIAAIDAQRDFWLADAALPATLIGRPARPSARLRPPASARPTPATDDTRNP